MFWIYSSNLRLWNFPGRGGAGRTVGNCDFNENPVIRLDLDFDLGFVNIFLSDIYIIIYLLPCFYIFLDILKNDLYNGQHSNSCTFPTTYLLALFSQFYQFCKFENASQNSLPFCFVQFLSLVVIRFHNLRHFWNSQGILFQKWPRFWKLFKDRWRYGTKHGRWQM